MTRGHRRLLIAAVAGTLLLPASAGAHDLDHPAPGFAPQGPVSTAFLAGGDGAAWELHTTIVTGNPHTDLDFFTSGGELYASVGTLAIGPNAGGQTVVRLTDGGRPSEDGNLDVEVVGSHPSAACVSNPSAALGLQHDVEATPKGEVLYNTDWGDAVPIGDAQLLLDATDAGGRCHDQGPLGLTSNPRGGLEIIDITDPAAPLEIALTSHIGEAHTVNVDPSRPHIAYAVSSDRVAINDDGSRANESDGFALDGFEVVDLSSCLEAPFGTLAAGTAAEDKRDDCRPEVYRFRFDRDWTRGTHTNGFMSGCHELEVHPNDILACAGVEGTLVLDMSGAFDDSGRPVGEPLPCDVRETNSAAPFATGAPVIDCVNGEDGHGLTVSEWLDIGAPSLEGIELIGFANHGGRDSGNNAFAHTPDEDIAVSHEAELSHSTRFLLVSDERGGAVVPPDASCPVPMTQPDSGNGGLHAFRMDALFTEYPGVTGEDGSIDGDATAEAARQAYARTPDGEPAIFRAVPRVPAESQCTAHVFQQIPGQNRIFMGWYTQGTQVVDYVENDDGTFEWHEAGFFIPENANQWVSHVFDFKENEDGTFTYWGMSADFVLTGHGRNAMDIYQVTLPAPRQFADPDGRDDGGPPGDRPECDKDRPGRRPPHCDDDDRPGGPPGDRPGPPEDRPGPAEGRGGGQAGGGDGQAPSAGTASTSDPGVRTSGYTRVIDISAPRARGDLREPTLTAQPASTTSRSPLLALLGGLTLLIAAVLRRSSVAAARPAVSRRRT